ncbi:MAG: Nif11-like leader peptide family natural product precursor [Lachnospiraceae bacterium]|nr:Nif11-like leader peptide family natural product precursor [Lachnospiraceae bacterium]
MKKSMNKVKDMIEDPNMKQTLIKVMNAKSPEDILAIAKEDGIALTLEQATTIYNGKRSHKEIDEEDMDKLKKIL